MEYQEVRQLTPVACTHCGKISNSRFCCPGCEAAFQLIKSAKLDAYYQYRTRPPQPVKKIELSDFSNYTHSLGSELLELNLALRGVDCSACAWLIERIPLIDSRIVSVKFHSLRQSAKIQFLKSISTYQVVTLFSELGFEPRPLLDLNTTNSLDASLRDLYLRTGVALGSWISSMHIALSLYAGILTSMESQVAIGLGWFSFAAALPAIFYSAQPFYRNAWLGLKTRRLTLDSFVSLTIFVGSIASILDLTKGRSQLYFEALAMLIFCLLLGRTAVKWFEIKIANRILSDQEPLLSLSRIYATGDNVIVKSGEAIPCDGVVVDGDSRVNTAWITGESKLETIGPNSQVLAGSINIGSPIQIKVSASGSQTQYGKMIDRWISLSKDPTFDQTQKLETLFVLISIAATASYALWAFSNRSFDMNILVALFLVSCPCALGLAVPLVYSSALAQALKLGILIKNGAVFSRLRRITNFVFDKTGTLTTPDLTSLKMEWNIFNLKKLKLSQEEVHNWIQIANQSSHHAGLVEVSHFLKLTSESSLNKTTICAVEHQGSGVELHFENQFVRIGKPEWAVPGVSKADQTFMIIGCQGLELVRFLRQTQPLQAPILDLMSRLKTENIYLISGDQKSVTDNLASQLGLDKAHALGKQTPEDKLQFIEKLKLKGPVLMAGDGINDTLALKKADVAVGIGDRLFSALENCDIFLTQNQIQKLSWIISASTRVHRAVVFNFSWTLIYNLLGFYLVLGGTIGPIACAILMPLSSITVALIALMTNYFPTTERTL
ncbi:MAG: heavy metal translocating P-type ATPase [Oligoflexia bacterium]|nr:heavy metal translocating P-type ATPase [Oligoflexia bacterium]